MINILYGKPVADKIYNQIDNDIKNLKRQEIYPNLAAVIIGDHPAARRFVEIKENQAQKHGIGFRLFDMLPSVKEDQIINLIDSLNNSHTISGIIIQLPLPPRINKDEIFKKICKEKDVDGLNRSKKGYEGFKSSTAEAILDILDYYKISLSSKKIVLVGLGFLVGRPLFEILSERKINVEGIDEYSKDIKKKCCQADILVVATGGKVWVSRDMVKKGSIIIDCGAPEPEIDINEIKEKISAITPVPGGVGPVTCAKLLQHTVEAVKNF